MQHQLERQCRAPLLTDRLWWTLQEVEAGEPPEKIKLNGAHVGWLKLKAALRWGIFVRKRAAERRAQMEAQQDEAAKET